MSANNDLEVVVKRIDAKVIDKVHQYPGISAGTKVLVTMGGAVAQAVLSRLASTGCHVTALGDEHASRSALSFSRIKIAKGSVLSSEVCRKAVEGQEVVFHTGRLQSTPTLGVSATHQSEAARQLVDGTRNLLEAAASAGVKRFVFLSSASVVFGGDDLIVSSDDAPYPTSHVDPISAALAEAEGDVLGANSGRAGASDRTSGMVACSVRAASVYGPGDECLLPGLATRARQGASMMGDGSNMVDFVFAGNVAHALMLAADKLGSPSDNHAADDRGDSAVGRAFFVTDMEPMPYGEFVRGVLAGLGYPYPDAMLPLALASFLAFLFRLLAMVLSPIVKYEPALTARRVAEEGRTQRFDASGARKVLGYDPLWSPQEGLEITLQESASLRNPKARVKYVGPFTPEDVAKHCTQDDAWIIVDNKVYDVTPYLSQHPGGDSMLRHAGGDSTKGFYGPQHPSQAKEILDRHYIGDLKVD